MPQIYCKRKLHHTFSLLFAAAVLCSGTFMHLPTRAEMEGGDKMK
jgi:hypothetical protein